jgi:hypothetical protein
MMRERLWNRPARPEATNGGEICGDVAAQLAEGIAELEDLDRRSQRHAGHCLRCQAEMAQQRRLVRALADLRASVVAPPPEFMTDVRRLLDTEPVPDVGRKLLSARRVAYAGGGLAVATAGAVSAVVLTARSRRTRLAG